MATPPYPDIARRYADPEGDRADAQQALYDRVVEAIGRHASRNCPEHLELALLLAELVEAAGIEVGMGCDGCGHSLVPDVLDAASVPLLVSNDPDDDIVICPACQAEGPR